MMASSEPIAPALRAPIKVFRAENCQAEKRISSRMPAISARINDQLATGIAAEAREARSAAT